MIVPHDADPGVRTCSEAWAECLREGGLDVRPTELADVTADATPVIVEPHAVLRPLAGDPVRLAGLLRHAVCVSTSRLASGALGADRPFHRAAGASVALSRDSARYLGAHGVPTAHLRPGAHARLRAPRTGARAFSVGTHSRYSGYREDVLARTRGVLDAYACDLRLSHSVAARPPGHLAAAEWLPWLAGLDVLVSLPREAGPGTEWCEVAPAVLNGAVVLTTAESDFGPLEPGDDIATATAPGFADSLRRLLADDDRRERMRASALARLEATPLDVSPLAEAIMDVAAQRTHARPLTPHSVPPEQDAPGDEEPAAAAAWEAAEAARTRRAAARTGAADRITTTSGWEALAAPDISVVIPSYNQLAYVGDALTGALAAVGVELEVVVIDDRSPDASAELVRSIMETNDGRAIKLVERADNIGLAGARNHGFEQSRAPFVLTLDADDAVLPHGPRALLDALVSDAGAAVAYGLLARIGLECEDFLGTEPWDRELFRHGNYVTAVALVRRSAWELVGGYTAEGLLELGWEDYDFWLRVAEAGLHGAHVRRIIGIYRLHGVSMSTVTNAHAGALMEFLRDRHPGLLGSHDA
jgi:GT2 family glycosyltransferase